MSDNIFGIILAGGSGSRLWPLSRELYPKQFLNFMKDKTLLQLTYQRLNNFIKPENIITVSNDKHLAGVSFQLSEIDSSRDKKILGEPLAKNTAPALALGLKYIKESIAEDSNPVILVAPSDHLITKEKNFKEAVMEGIDLSKQGYIVTFGIKPSSAETGYGYIKVLPGEKAGKTGIKADCFKEKPDYKTAVEYYNSKEHFWNSGIFMFSLKTLQDEFKKLNPFIINKINEINLKKDQYCKEIYEQLPSISIDYAIMEKSEKIVLIPAEFDWNDLGSWDAIYDVSPKDYNNNVINGNVIDIDCQNSLIYSTSRLVSAIGMDENIIVETDDAVLICKRNESQRVKEAFDTLKKRESELYKSHKTIKEDWGRITNLQKDDSVTINKIIIRENYVFNLQKSDKNLKHYYITKGKSIFKLENSIEIVDMGQSADIKDEPLLSIENSGSEELEIIEVIKH